MAQETKKAPDLRAPAGPDLRARQRRADPGSAAQPDSPFELDTVPLRTLPEDALSAFDATTEIAAGENPYENASSHPPPRPSGRRRTLDDMRKLSEEIKRTRGSKKSGA